MGSNCGVDLSQQLPHLEEIDIRSSVLFQKFIPVDLSLLTIVLQLLINALDIVIDLNTFSAVANLLSFDQRMIEDLLPTHTLFFSNSQALLQEIFCVASNLSIVREG